MWLATDRVYRAASNRLIRIKGDEKLRTEAADKSDDFSKEDPQVFFSTAPHYKFDSADWTKRLRKLSAEFTKYPGALNSAVGVEVERVAKTLVTTEGTRLEHGRLFARLMITARGKASRRHGSFDHGDLRIRRSLEASQGRADSGGARKGAGRI